MTDLNPLAGAIIGSAHAQRQLEVEKARQLRRSQAARKSAGARDGELDHQVESAQELNPVHDDAPRREQPGKQRRHDAPEGPDDRPHVDIKA